MTATHEFRLPRTRRPNSGWRSWGGTVARSLYAGVFVGAISGFVTLLISIVSIVIGELLFRRLLIEIPIIYRTIAPAVAIAVAVLVFLGNLLWERTHSAPAPAERT
jgi:hypothetical protein